MGTAFLTTKAEEGEILIPLDHGVTVGSSMDCEVRVKTAAPRHAQVSKTAEGYLIKDLTGQGLVRVNGAVVARQALKDGDVVKIGAEEFRFARDESVTLVIEPEPAPALHPASRKRNSTTHIAQVRISTPPESRKPALWWASGGIAVFILIIVVIVASSGTAPRKETATVFPIPKTSASSAPLVAREAPFSARTAEFQNPSVAPPATPEAARDLPVPQIASNREVPFAVTATPATAPPTFALGELAAFLREPSRRSSTAERSRMAQAIRTSRPDGQVIRALGVILSLPESSWTMSPTAQHAWTVYLRECPLEDLSRLSAEDHVAQARRLLDAGATPALRLVALGHLLDAGAGVFPGQHGFRQSQDGKIWGDGDALLHYRLSRASGGDISSEGLTASSSFGVRYAAMILQIRRAIDRGTGFESTYNDLSAQAGSGAPSSAEAHLKALKLSFKNGVRCKECKEGRIRCPDCEGKTRRDFPCSVCNGSGRTLASGAIDGARVTVKCRNCDGKKVFKDVGCPTCSRTGSVVCTSCAGRPWRDASCTVVACRMGRVPCTNCNKRGKVDAPCPDCNGTGRVAAPGAVDGARVTQKCRTCNENHGVFKLGAKCQPCDGTGWVPCDTCKGKPGEAKSSIPLAEVFTTEPCRDCAGEGWPWAPLPAACPACLGLGSRVKPTADPSKVLD